MSIIKEVRLPQRPLGEYEPIVGKQVLDQLREYARKLMGLSAGATVWHINSTEAGGGVAGGTASLLSRLSLSA